MMETKGANDDEITIEIMRNKELLWNIEWNAMEWMSKDMIEICESSNFVQIKNRTADNQLTKTI